MHIWLTIRIKDEPLPRYLSAEQLSRLDEQYNHSLTWQILDSDVTDEQIAEFEFENEIMLPKSFREFVQGYSFLHSRFYPECVEYKCSRLEVDFFGISNPNGLQHYKDNEFPPIKKVKYIDVASIGEQWISLDCEMGVVRSWWSDELTGEACSKEEYEEGNGREIFGLRILMLFWNGCLEKGFIISKRPQRRKIIFITYKDA